MVEDNNKYCQVEPGTGPVIMDKEEREGYKAQMGNTDRATLQNTVEQFEKITHDMFNLEVRMRELSARKLLEEFLARDPDPQAIYAFFRVVEELHQAWLALLQKGKAPTRKAIGHASPKSMANSGNETKEKPPLHSKKK